MAETERRDRRVKYTQAVLKETLLALLADRPIERISVTDLCARADVNRSTFYAHYASPDALLSAIKADFIASLERLRNGESGWDNLYIEIARAMRANRALFSAQFKRMDFEFCYRVISVGRGRLLSLIESQTGLGGAEAEGVYAYMATGICGILMMWSFDSLPGTEKEIAATIERLIAATLKGLA